MSELQYLKFKTRYLQVLLLSSFVNFSMFVANRIISWFIFSNMKYILYLKGHKLGIRLDTSETQCV